MDEDICPLVGDCGVWGEGVFDLDVCACVAQYEGNGAVEAVMPAFGSHSESRGMAQESVVTKWVHFLVTAGASELWRGLVDWRAESPGKGDSGLIIGEP